MNHHCSKVFGHKRSAFSERIKNTFFLFNHNIWGKNGLIAIMC